jgi:hypothetical protein
MSAQEAFRGDLSYPLVLNSSFTPTAAAANFGWYDTIDKGIPFLAGPDLSRGRVALPNSLAMQTAVPSTTERGTTYSWNVALERRLPIVAVDAAYVGNKMINGLQPINANPVLHLGGGAADRPYFVSHGRQLAINLYQPYQKSTYHALQVGLTRPFLNGLQLKGHYTYSRSRSLGTSYQLPTPEAQDRNWALASTDRPHTFTMSFVYQLPWQTSGAGHGFPRILFSDWQINGIVMAFSGAPFTVTADGTALNTPNNTQTADLVGTVTKIGGIGAGGVYFDPSAWAQPEGMRFGTSRLNQFRGPGGWNLDLSVFRSIPIGPRQRIELRAEAANVTNTFKFANPTANITSGDFMRIFGLNNAFTERQIRLGLRFTF